MFRTTDVKHENTFKGRAGFPVQIPSPSPRRALFDFHHCLSRPTDQRFVFASNDRNEPLGVRAGESRHNRRSVLRPQRNGEDDAFESQQQSNHMDCDYRRRRNGPQQCVKEYANRRIRYLRGQPTEQKAAS